jgi:peptidoglycan/xylan/chitin deacetylase (PgdA/CDA1 family)
MAEPHGDSMTRYRTPLGLGLLLVVAIAFGLFWLSRSRHHQAFGDLVARVETDERVVALTLDDGPVPGATEEVLAILVAKGVKATFFLTGAEIERNPDAARRIVEAGHEIGNHSFSHERMVLMSQERIAAEVERTDTLIRNAGYQGPILFRPPFGKKLFGLPYYLDRHDRTSVTWDVEPDSHAEASANSEWIVRHVVETARPGSIVLLHVMYPSRRTSMEAIAGIIDELSARGYRFVTVTELLALRGQ